MQKISPRKVLDSASIGERIKCLILQEHSSILDFSRQTGISASVLYRIIHGEAIPSPDTLVDLSSCLGCSVDFLLGVSTPETEAGEGFETALLNVYEFRDVWTRDQKMYLAYASMNLLTASEEEKLKQRLGIGRAGKQRKISAS